MWNEIAAGPKSKVAANASLSSGRPVWLIANGLSVRSRSRLQSCNNSLRDRVAVPTLPNAPAFETAAASSTSSPWTERRQHDRQVHAEEVTQPGSDHRSPLSGEPV